MDKKTVVNDLPSSKGVKKALTPRRKVSAKGAAILFESRLKAYIADPASFADASPIDIASYEKAIAERVGSDGPAYTTVKREDGSLVAVTGILPELEGTILTDGQIEELVEAGERVTESEPVDEAPESSLDRVIRLREEAKANPPAATVVPPAATEPAKTPEEKKASNAKAKSSRFATTAIKLVNPEAASPVWKGKRGKAFGIIEDFYTELDEAVNAGERKTDELLTVGEWLTRVTVIISEA